MKFQVSASFSGRLANGPSTGRKAYLFRTREALKELYSNGELKQPHELSKLLP
jgi:hypothetical protein